VVHKALIAVDEDGTQAAAASAPEMQGTTAVDPSIKTDVINLIIDRPFFFVIHDTQTHSILFMGQVVDPQ
jgi:serpin B